MNEIEIKLVLHQEKLLEKIATKFVALDLPEDQVKLLKNICQRISYWPYLYILEELIDKHEIFSKFENAEEIEVWFNLFYIQYKPPLEEQSKIKNLTNIIIDEFISFYNSQHQKE